MDDDATETSWNLINKIREIGQDRENLAKCSKKTNNMWDFTKEDKRNIEDIYKHFLPLITEVSKEQLYDRIFCGYCWSEGGFRLVTIADWEVVFGLKEGFSESVFDSWEDYFKYEGDWHRKRPWPTAKTEGKEITG